MSFPPVVKPFAPSSGPPWPGSTNTVAWRFAPNGGNTTQAPSLYGLGRPELPEGEWPGAGVPADEPTALTLLARGCEENSAERHRRTPTNPSSSNARSNA